MDDNKFNKKISSLGEISKVQLSKILNNSKGPKDLLLESKIIKPLERICGVRWLMANGVEKIYKIDNALPCTSDNAQYFMIYTSINTFKNVVDMIRSKIDPENPVKNKYHIILVPKILHLFEEILEELGLYGSVVQMYALQWQPICLDTGILSLELPNVYKNVFVHSEYSLLPSYAKSLWHMFFVFGKPKLTLALGNLSSAVLNQYDIISEQMGDSDKFESEFGALVLMDRNMDYPSVLLTPGTYTGLLNEIFSVNCGFCEYKSAGEKKYDEKCNLLTERLPVSFPLDSKKDTVYKDIKHRYFTEVTSVLSVLTKQLRIEGESSKEMALDEIKLYVKTKLQEATSKKKQITNHLQAAESIINVLGNRFEKQQHIEQNIMLNQSKTSNSAFLEEILVTENNKLISLRLLCLMSLTQKLTESEIKSFWNKYVLEFGYKYGYVYSNLIKAGFISESTNSNLSNKIMNIPKLITNNFYTNANKLKLIPTDPEKIDLKAPTSCSYVFAGSYIPLISVIAGMLANNTSPEEIKTKLELYGPLTFKNEKGYPIEPRSLLISIIGGISYAEVAACNLLEVLTQTKITILTDKIISGNDIVDALF